MTIAVPPAPDACALTPIELWGGHECSVNRVGDRWFDQTLRSGHQHRIGDLALFAGIGIRRLRYPALWERMAPDRPDATDFDWTDERLAEIRRLGMAPVLTLCHHGSGPHYTSLMHDNFASGLAAHAGAVAARYPWVEDYTPVNEPLTTARFSALYGFWYPHLRDETAMWTALLNQTDATRFAMRAVRRVNPAARLVQTDDLGFCHASEPLQRNADFQNERRWMSWDLLCGMVVPGHRLWDRIAACGLGDRLRAIAHDPCPPDIIGVNHYLSSERLVDHRIEHYADRALADGGLGSSDGVVHVNVDAVRYRSDAAIGMAGLVKQAWQRYRIPVAITECHNACTREEQVRWFVEAWQGAAALRQRDVDVRAVTAWSLLGSYDWNRLLMRSTGHYEPGVFDVRGGSPRPTMLAGVLKDLAAGVAPDAPGLKTPGWWRRRWGDAPAVHDDRPLLIVADDGLPTRLVVQACQARGLALALVEDARRAPGGWAIIDARHDADAAALASVCVDRGMRGACLSGRDRDCPPGLLAVFHGPLYSADDDSCWPARILDALDRGEAPPPAAERPWEGIYAWAMVDVVIDLLLDGVTGPHRLTATEPWSESQFAQALAFVAGHDPHRPDMVASDTTLSLLPHVETMIERYVADRRRARRAEVSADRHASIPDGLTQRHPVRSE